MIYPGTDLKFKVTAVMVGFDINEDNMTLLIKNRWGKTCYRYTADDFFEDPDGNWYFTMPNARTGIYFAFLTCYRGDKDFEANSQRVVDVQYLVNVGVCPCKAKHCACPRTDGLEVHYERVWTVNLNDGVYLADMYGNPILTTDGELIRFSDPQPQSKDVRINMTSDEFKHWMDDKDDDGRIDTRREIEDALGGFDDNTELEPMTQAEARAMMNDILNNG